MRAAAIGLAALAAALPGVADVVSSSPGHFEVTHRGEVAATPAQVYAVLAQLPRWWDPRHSWSGDTANMSLDLQAGGCWCERWGNGASAQHARVRQVIPGRLILLEATLGPMIGLPVQGVFTMVSGEKDGKTVMRLTYRVASAPEVGLDKIAPAVDDVLAIQFGRLKTMVETGKPPG